MANKIQTNKELLEIYKNQKTTLKRTATAIDNLDAKLTKLHGKEDEANKKDIAALQKKKKEWQAMENRAVKGNKTIGDTVEQIQSAEKAVGKLSGKWGKGYETMADAAKDLLAVGASKEEAANLEKAAKSALDVETNVENVGTEEFKLVDFNKRLLELRRKSATGLSDAEDIEFGILDTAQKRNLVLQQEHKILQKQQDTWDNMLGSVSGMLGKIPLVGGMLETKVQGALENMTKGFKEGFIGKKGMGGMMMGGLGIAGLLVGALISIANKAKEAGLGMNQAMSAGGALLVNADMVSQMADDFGHINEATTKLGAQLKINQTLLGIQTKDSVKILRMQQATTSLSNDELISQQKATAAMAKAAGLPIGKVMEDIANSSEYFALNAREGGDNIARAAIEAKKLGLNLSAVEAIQESLLNLESSLQAQMEAQVLIGREINLDRARALALSGDQAGLMQEIVRQAGSEAEFARLNFIERKKLAQAFGLTGAQLAKVVSGAGGATTPTLHTGGKVTKSGPVSLQRGEVVYNQGQQDALMGALKKVEKAINSQTVDAKDNTRKQINATRGVGVTTG